MTVTEIEDLRNECVRETEDNLNRRILGNHKYVNKGYYIKKKSSVWYFPLPFLNIACGNRAIWYYFTLCHCVEPTTPWETTKGVVKYMKNKPPSYGTMYLIGIPRSSPFS